MERGRVTCTDGAGTFPGVMHSIGESKWKDAPCANASGDPGWATASSWLLGVGLGFAVLAAATGLTDYLGNERIRRLSNALKHMLANVAAVVLELVNFVLRIGNDDFIASTGVYISAVVALILLYSGWKGGDLVYKHGVGVHDRPGG